MATLKDFVEKFGSKNPFYEYIIFSLMAKFSISEKLLNQTADISIAKEIIHTKILEMRYQLLEKIDSMLEELNKIEVEQSERKS